MLPIVIDRRDAFRKPARHTLLDLAQCEQEKQSILADRSRQPGDARSENAELHRRRYPSASAIPTAAMLAIAALLTSLPQEALLADHKFKIGQTVDYSPGRLGMPAMSRLYKVVKLLPTEDGQLLYRIKGSSEPFERIAREKDLSRP